MRDSTSGWLRLVCAQCDARRSTDRDIDADGFGALVAFASGVEAAQHLDGA